jgi:hypothetical protein
MKLNRVKIILLAAFALTNGIWVRAQSNSVPGAADYAQFSQFVTDRNIFDPNRVPHTIYTPRVRVRTTHTRVSAAPAFSLVGTMSYAKGVFAFFNGNDPDLKKALPVNAKIADYTVRQIAPGRVWLESADKKETLELKVGDVMRQDGASWEWSGTGDLPVAANSAAAAENPPDGETSAAPSPALQQNEVLKRLMELRKKEEQ